MEFFVSFGVQYGNGNHPTWKDAEGSGYVTIVADDDDQARAVANAWFNRCWSFMYHDRSEMTEQHWPAGELHRVDVSSHSARVPA